MSDIQTRIPNNVLYCVMCGRFTPDQRTLARKRARVDTQEFMKLYTWLRDNNINFVSHPDDPQCPTPIIIEEKDNKNSIDESVNPAIEKSCEFKYYFPSTKEPTKQDGTYDDEIAFATALLEGTQPTLLFHPGGYCKEHTTAFTDIFPVQFPFGHGDIFTERSPPVSKEECIRHYCKISLPQFRRDDFLLVAVHMYHRILSFETGLLKCKATFDSKYCLAEKVSKLTTQDIIKAVKAHKDGENVTIKMVVNIFSKQLRHCADRLDILTKQQIMPGKNTWRCGTTLVLLLSFLQ